MYFKKIRKYEDDDPFIWKICRLRTFCQLLMKKFWLNQLNMIFWQLTIEYSILMCRLRSIKIKTDDMDVHLQLIFVLTSMWMNSRSYQDNIISFQMKKYQTKLPWSKLDLVVRVVSNIITWQFDDADISWILLVNIICNHMISNIFTKIHTCMIENIYRSVAEDDTFHEKEKVDDHDEYLQSVQFYFLKDFEMNRLKKSFSIIWGFWSVQMKTMWITI